MRWRNEPSVGSPVKELRVQSVDVAIVGGGMVGLALACGLQGSGLRVAVLEQTVPEPQAADSTLR